MKTAIIISKKDKAGMNIYENLKDLKNVFLMEEDSIDCDKVEEADSYIFATKHQSVSGKPSLLVHVPGNFGKAEYGGKSKKLCKSSRYLKDSFLLLKKLNKNENYEVSVESVHHGPYLDKEVMFIELGSNEKDWGNKEEGELISKVIKKILKKIKKYKTVIVLGGGHYNVVANKILERTEYDISFICPKHYLEELDEEMMKQMLEKSHNKVEKIVLDYKGLGKSKRKVLDLLEKMGLEWVKSKELLTTS
tara:strand:+ start:553 stop:1299 length:747 start_codon:yes stop_codon:yes gene_type:complete